MAGVKTYRMHEVNSKLRITIPRVLAQIVGIATGDVVDRGEPVLSKAGKK